MCVCVCVCVCVNDYFFKNKYSISLDNGLIVRVDRVFANGPRDLGSIPTQKGNYRNNFFHIM